MNEHQREYFRSILRRMSPEELQQTITAQGLEAPDGATRDELVELAASDKSVPESEYMDLSGNEPGP